jgi:alpha-galactosidase
MAIHHLCRGGVSVVLDTVGGLPEVLYWGVALGADADVTVLPVVSARPRVSDSADEPVRVAVVPEHSAGWLGRPGLSGHRAAGAFSQRFTGASEPDGDRLVTAVDGGGLHLDHTLELTEQGLVRQRVVVRNDGGDDYTLDDLSVTMPVPLRAVEVLDFAGRHLRERSPQRAEWHLGLREHENRRGRTALQSTTLVVVGERGFGFGAGQVWAVHTAWSGNHRMYAEHQFDARKLIGGGELLLPGEIVLAPGESYAGPWVYFAFGDGLDELSARFHGWLRARPGRASRPRPVTANSWEAVYFDHELGRLGDLADRAGALGAERFVLDDGWFGSRRSDDSGLGDWTVSPDVWPDGLDPLIDRVRAAGMEFGLWVEPEMINPDSDLARAHPEWVMAAAADRWPILARHQQVLDLTQPGAYAHVRDALLALLDRYDIAYLKWDHNRDLVEAADQATGQARVHGQTLAFYRLLDELRAEHPELEIESCSSGGGRVDLEVLERSDRIWTSDCIDPLERQQIQRWTGLLVPPELMGSHIGAMHAHTTGRRQQLSFRAATAFFGHLGMEWDLAAAAPHELDEAAWWIATYKEHRDLIATGRTVRVDDPDPARLVHGIVAPDRGEALFAVVMMTTSVHYPSGQVLLAGLEASARYRVTVLQPPSDAVEHGWPAWVDEGVTTSGALLMEHGLAAPNLPPEHAVVLHAVRV